MLTISFFENWDLKWYSHCDVNCNDKLFYECAYFIHYFSVTSWWTSLA